MRRAQIALVGLSIVATGCPSGERRASPSASASASVAKVAMPPAFVTGPVPVAIPVPVEKVAKAVNGKGQQPYSGPTGVVVGRITYGGDPPPDGATNLPPKCPEAAATYGKLFRVGPEQALADALVTVVGYQAYVPASGPSVDVALHGCATSKRTVAVTYGQHIEVSNKDATESYMPYLDGAPTRAIMVAIPHGAPVKLYPGEPGHYMIKDELPKPFFGVDVFVLKFATHDVTGLDGKYRIERVPAGKVRVDAFLPALGKSVGKELEVKEGENVVDFELTYDKANDRLPSEPPKPQPAPSGSASASAPKPRKSGPH